MLHAAPRAVRGTLLFRSWQEASLLWDAVTLRVPRVHHLFLMPDHLHARISPEHWPALQTAMAAYAQARNRLRGESGPVWEWGHKPTWIADAQKQRRTDRYILLNACRKGITDDPLSWPFSTLRDSLGLAILPVRQPVGDPYRFLSYVCRDDHVRPGMADLPLGLQRAATLVEVEAAVSSLTRTPAAALRTRGAVRTLLVRSCRTLTDESAARIGIFVGISERSVRRCPQGLDSQVQVVARVAGSARFGLLGDGDLRREPGWRDYRWRR